MAVDTLAPDCPVKPKNLPRPRPVSVNGVLISRADISRETQNHPAAKPIEAWLAAARALVVRELLLQEARRLGLTAAPATDDAGRRETDEEALVRQVVAQEVERPTPDEPTCRRFYEHNADRFRSADLAEVRHILIAADPRLAEARATARTEAEAIIRQLTDQPQLFAALAEARSACPSGRSGGNLGQIGPGQTVPEFEAAAARAPVGRVAPEPVETRYGYHVIRIDRRVEGRQLPFELAEDRIRAWLAERAWRTAVRRFILRLAERAEISGIDLDTSPLGSAD